MDLIRKILLKIEQHETDNPIQNIEIEGYSRDIIAYHVYLLKEAELIDAVISSGMGSTKVTNYAIINLTWKGHEFLDASRDETIWAKAKMKIKSMGGNVPFEVITPLLIALIKKKIGMS